MMGKDWDIYRGENQGYHPRTQNAALRSFMAGIIQPGEFMLKMLSLQALNLEPWDLGEIDRVLARRDLEITTILVLIPVLQKIIRQHNPEQALSAAESLGLIEKRYLARIENLRRALEVLDHGKERQEAYKRLVQDLYEYSCINAPLGTLRNYYLKEAMETSTGLEHEFSLTKDDYLARIHILEDLGLHRQVEELLRRPEARHILDRNDLVPLQAANAFYRKEFAQVAHILEEDVSADMDEAAQFWNVTTRVSP